MPKGPSYSSPNYGKDTFLRTPEVASMLFANTRTVYDLLDLIHYLSTGNTHLFPRQYIQGLVQTQIDTGREFGARVAADFAKSESARKRVRQVEASYEAALKNRLRDLETGQSAIPALGAASLLGVAGQTVDNWAKGQMLTGYDKHGEAKLQIPSKQYFLESDFREFCKWHDPTRPGSLPIE